MKHTVAITVAILPLGFACASSTSSTDQAVTVVDLTAETERLTSDVAWLADDAREGRRAGTAGEQASAEWLAARLAELDLEPAGEKKTWFQAFSVPLPIEDRGQTSIQNGEVVISGKEAIVPLFCSEGGQAAGQVVFVGYGIENPEVGWNDFKKLKGEKPLHGKIALMVRGAPRVAKQAPSLDGKETDLVQKGDAWVAASGLFTKVMNAKRRGAKAVIVAQHPALDEPLLRFDASRPAQAGIPAVLISAKAAGELLEDYDSRVHDLDRPEDTRLAGRPLAAPKVVLDADVHREKGTATNVLALLGGLDADRCVVVGAHFDHLGHGDTGTLALSQVGEIHNGADDNASGTAAVLEIARILSAGEKPACNVLFALWSGEELGLLGSEYWAEHPTVRLDDVVANLNLDMVGRANAGKLQVLGAGSSAAFTEWLEKDGVVSGVELSVNSSGFGIGGSDHQTFLKRRIPALHFFSGVHDDYHKPTDDVARFEAEGAARVVELSVDIVRRMAAADRLAFVEPKVEKRQGDPAQQQVTSTGWSTWFGSVPEYSFEGQGVKLSGTTSGSPAERAGLLKGDVLTHVGDVKIDSIYDFTYALQVYKPGDTVLAQYTREGKPESVRVTLATRVAH